MLESTFTSSPNASKHSKKPCLGKLNDAFTKNSIKHIGRASGNKHGDGSGLYLQAMAAGK
ncbi:hypothetical protein [Polaromonas sp. CG9_12]|nr:hypothetical protein [Polaromonas sp. CG9_12]